MKADMVADTSINAGISKNKGKILIFLIPSVSQPMTPLSSSPIAIIIRDSTVMVAGFAKPLIASSGFVNPKATSATMIKKDILSIGNHSVTNNTSVRAITIKMRIISVSKGR